MRRTAALRYPTPAAVPWPLLRHDGPASITITPDGRMLASAGRDGKVRVVELASGRVVIEVDVGAPVVDVGLTSAAVLVAVGAEVRSIHGQLGRSAAPVVFPAPVLALEVSPDATGWAVITAAGQVSVHRTLTGRKMWAHPVVGATSLTFGADGSVLVGTADGEVVGLVAAGEGTRRRVATAPVTRVRAGWTLAGGCLVDDAGTVTADGVTSFDVLDDVVVIPTTVGRDDVVELVLHPGLGHVAVATADGAVGLLAIPE